MKISEKTPDLIGKLGRAWKVQPAPGQDIFHVAAWVINAPYAHPTWSNYLLACYHLRPVPDTPAPIIYLPGATHEMVLQACNPDFEPELSGESIRTLRPSNFAAQLIQPDDNAARALIEAAVQDVIDGKLNPDTDFRRLWALRFGSNMLRS